MIKNATMYRRVCEEVSRLEKLIEVKAATPRDVERYQAGLEECLCWEWEHEDAPAVEVMPPLPSLRDRRALAFADWWERNEHQIDLDTTFWPDAFTWWVEPMQLSEEQELALHLEVSAEMNERQWLRAHGYGMVITHLEAIPDGDGEEANAA